MLHNMLFLEAQKKIFEVIWALYLDTKYNNLCTIFKDRLEFLFNVECHEVLPCDDACHLAIDEDGKSSIHDGK